MGRKRVRLDTLLVERGWFSSRSRARAAILAGKVRVDGRRVKLAPARRTIIVLNALFPLNRGGMRPNIVYYAALEHTF